MSIYTYPKTLVSVPSNFHNISIITLSNSNNIHVKVITRGASIYEFCVPDRFGNVQNIVLKLDSLDQYGNDSSFAGATLGPSAGRIPHGKLTIADKTFQLTQNEQNNHLHGGYNNFSKMNWTILSSDQNSHQASVTLGASIPDGIDGYPGLRQITVCYSLDENNMLSIAYRAQSDRLTWLNLSNHTYWNLSGKFSQTALDHYLQIPAANIWYNDTQHIPTSLQKTSNTPFDFNTPKKISEQIKTFSRHSQLQNAQGYNNAYILDGTPAAVLTHPDSRRRIRLYTDYPSLVFYSGGYLNSNTLLDGTLPAIPSCALALEPQELPLSVLDSPIQQPLLPLRPGDIWERNIQIAFDIEV